MDLDNFIDPKKCNDQIESIKYMLPFYRTEITQFEERLNSIDNVINVNEVNTKFVRVDDLERAFRVTRAWNDSWANVEILLKSFMFKELVMTCTTDGINYKF